MFLFGVGTAAVTAELDSINPFYDVSSFHSLHMPNFHQRFIHRVIRCRQATYASVVVVAMSSVQCL
jgi:transposase-like protein